MPRSQRRLHFCVALIAGFSSRSLPLQCSLYVFTPITIDDSRRRLPTLERTIFSHRQPLGEFLCGNRKQPEGKPRLSRTLLPSNPIVEI
ncbi:unnamed protein product [Chondrus crispus]|uniref:Secreted protein n=1 Tax=Chondrus crispus TaxID=2769 RepID=R7QLV6_CHOCR|nr:unnamed protein product [Chondrus crispus]CDF38375.1 unnamed protein product [Chondrus crispus]|eukprot:XP_005718260.1 unnamed protein product [Chondrus crispus]